MDKKMLEKKRNFWVKILLVMVFLGFIFNEAPLNFVGWGVVVFLLSAFMAGRREWQIIQLEEAANKNCFKAIKNKETGEYVITPSRHSGVR